MWRLRLCLLITAGCRSVRSSCCGLSCRLWGELGLALLLLLRLRSSLPGISIPVERLVGDDVEFGYRVLLENLLIVARVANVRNHSTTPPVLCPTVRGSTSCGRENLRLSRLLLSLRICLPTLKVCYITINSLQHDPSRTPECCY